MEGYRLSPQQHRLWRLQPRNNPFRVQCLMRLEGELRREELERALDGLIARHEVLRTHFPSMPGMEAPVQVIAERGVAEWEQVDLRELPLSEREARAREHFEKASQRPFPLETGPVLRVVLVTLDARWHLLGLVLPAMCADAATLKQLGLELQRLHASPASLQAEEPEPLSYLSFSEWQNELLAERADPASPAAAFWAQHGSLAKAGLVLPLERRAGGCQAYEPASSQLIRWEAERVTQLEAAARAAHCTLEDLVLAVWGGLLWKLTGQAEWMMGVLSDGREHPELAKTNGPLARWLPLPFHFRESQPLGELAQQLHESLAEAREWQRYFLWQTPTGEPVAGQDYPAIGFRWESQAEPPVIGSGALRFELERAYVDRSKVCLACTRTPSALELELQYDQGLFSGDAILQLGGYLEASLEQLSRTPGVRLDELEPMSERERQRLLVTFNETKQELPPRCVHTGFEEQAVRHPERTAVVYEERSLTYAQLDAQANRVAQALRKRGVGPEVRVGLFLNRSLEILVGILGVMKAGGAYVPLEPSQPRQRLLFLMEDIQAPVILTERKLLKLAPTREGCEVLCLDEEEAFAQEPALAPESGVGPEHPAYVLFTSGTTGRPKGVVVEHRQLHNYIASVQERLELPEGASYATISTFAADLGNTVIFPALCNGSTLHVLAAERVTDPIALAEYTRRHPIDCLKIVPSHLRALMSAGNARELLPRQRLILGGEATPRAWAEQLQALVPECRIYNHYGPTETTVGVLTFHLEPTPRPSSAASLPLARPIANTQVYVLDARLRPVPTGVPGELYIAGAALARGYLSRPDLTAQAFIPNPFSTEPGARMYRTGDLGQFLPDGTLEHLGRADNQVKYHGYRIELAELRHALNQHPQVRDSVVMLKKDANGNDVLAAYYVSRQELEREQLRGFLSEHVIDEVLPNIYIHLRKLPLTLNGKVHYDGLPSIEEARKRQRSALVPPRNPVEETLAGIWCQVLNLKELSVHDNFFSLGGDSILGILVISKANQAGLGLTPRQLFQHQTIAELASVATELRMAHAEEGPVTGPIRLTPIQRWFFEQQPENPEAWCVVVPLEARQPLDVTRLEQALNALKNHHDALRLRVVRGTGGWEASIASPEEPVPFERLELSSVPDGALEERLRQLSRELQSKLRLDRGPMMLAAWLELGPHRPSRLLILAHRLVIDGVSWRILAEHLQLAYQQLVERGECQLPPRTTSLKAWTERLHEHAATPAQRQELELWGATTREQVQPLPVDRPAALPLTLEQSLTHALTPEESRVLLHELPEAYRCEIGELLIATLGHTLSGWSGQKALLLDLEGHGREDLFENVDLSRTVGWFTSLYPVLLTPEGGPGAAVRSTKELLRALPHRGLGYGVLRYLGEDPAITARLAALPRAEALFRYVGQYNNTTGPLLSVLDHPEQQAPTRSHKLAIVARMVDQQLHVSWYYSAAMYERSTLEALAARYVESLRTLLAERGSPEQPVLAPSDFPLAGLNQQQLDKLLARIKK